MIFRCTKRSPSRLDIKWPSVFGTGMCSAVVEAQAEVDSDCNLQFSMGEMMRCRENGSVVSSTSPGRTNRNSPERGPLVRRKERNRHGQVIGVVSLVVSRDGVYRTWPEPFWPGEIRRPSEHDGPTGDQGHSA